MTDLSSVNGLLRKTLRQQRRALSKVEAQHAAQAVVRQVARQSWFLTARHVAFYQAFDGELDPQPLLALAQTLGKVIYLPVVPKRGPRYLRFVRVTPGTRWKRNRFGILEPLGGLLAQRWPWELDVVVAPLVAFNHQGHRLGMGGGYYDRSFAFLSAARIPRAAYLAAGIAHRKRARSRIQRRTRLIGLAYAFQQVPDWEIQRHDVRMHAVLTPDAIFRGDWG